MTIYVKTETGSYEFTDDLLKVRRVAGGALRRDNQWLKLQSVAAPLVGVGMVLILEPLGVGDTTVRMTNIVTDISEEKGTINE